MILKNIFCPIENICENLLLNKTKKVLKYLIDRINDEF